MTTGSQYRTYAFRNFKAELTTLSQLYWTFSFTGQATSAQLATLNPPPTAYLKTVLPVNHFEHASYHITVGEFHDRVQPLIDHQNLLLLVKACANFEGFLHRFAHIWAIAHKHESPLDSGKISQVGNALIAPALKSNIASSLDYLEKLTAYDSGPFKAKFSKAYQLRNLAAHNAGVYDWESAKTFQDETCLPGKRIHLSWDRLREYLKAMEKTAAGLETHLPVNLRKSAEIRILTRQIVLKAKPDSDLKVREILIKMFGCHKLPAQKRLAQIIKTIKESAK